MLLRFVPSAGGDCTSSKTADDLGKSAISLAQHLNDGNIQAACNDIGNLTQTANQKLTPAQRAVLTPAIDAVSQASTFRRSSSLGWRFSFGGGISPRFS